MRKTTKKKAAPIVITVGVVLYMVPLVGISLLSIGGLAEAGEFAAAPFLLTYAVLGGAVIAGIIRALLQRLDEIDGGEEEEASRY
ncbi:MAG: hypothetical protein K2L38_07005 [Dysosmobacter sp.]|nr:hypothetical protein [Dysosmobacter sp.]